MKFLESLWPTAAVLGETLGSDAHTLDKSVFLAVHQPMRFRKVEYGAPLEQAPIVREQDVLEALLAESGEGRVIIPIAGPSGSGKSHVIRWLEAALVSRNDAMSRHVILVPKSSSLKSVIRRILEGLDGPNYQQIREKLEGASESLPEVAAKDLRTRLVSAITADADEAQARLRERSSNDRDGDEILVWAKSLAALLEDPELWRLHFYGDSNSSTGVIKELAEHVSKEGTANRRHEFLPSDFSGLERLVSVGNLSLPARKPVLMLSDDAKQALAAKTLNKILDKATQSLLDLGGTPLSEVFLDLRRALLEDEKELVILVEDFAVLSGMQGALLDALIHEGRVGGKRKYCTIRSALAYTHGYQPMDRDTVRTRAGAEWIIEEVPGNEEEILGRTVELVAAYWNASRWGVSALRRQHREAVDGNSWTQSFESNPEGDEEIRIVEAFGRSQAGYPLFPLNLPAIHTLAREKCKVSGRIVFNPRLVIDRLVLEVAKLRGHYLKAAFPPASIGTTKLTSAEVIQVINQQPVKQRPQLLTLVTYWGEVPDSPGEAAQLKEGIYQAFGLPAIDFGKPLPPPPPEPPQPEPDASTTPDSGGVGHQVDPFDKEWKHILDGWQRGERLGNTEARNLRNWICEAVLGSVWQDWPGSRLRIDKTKVAAQHTYLPNAKGATGLSHEDAAISLCSDEVWADPLQVAPIRQALDAIVRYRGPSETRGTWNFAGGEIQAARYANFVHVGRPKLMSWQAQNRTRYQEQKDFSLTDLIENRIMSAAVLGVSVKGGDHLESAVGVLFQKDLPVPTLDAEFPERWKKLLELAKAEGDKSWKDLIEATTARQGTGEKILAFDVASFHGPLRGFLKTWIPTGDTKGQREFVDTMWRGVESRRDQIHKWVSRTQEWLGEECDKHATILEIRDLLTEAKQLGACTPSVIDELRNQLDMFRDLPLQETLNAAGPAKTETKDGRLLTCLAFDYSRIMLVTDALFSQIDTAFSQIERESQVALETGGASVVTSMIGQVKSELERSLGLIAEYMEAHTNDGP